MKITEQIIQMAQENNGIVTTSMVVASGASRGILQYLVDKGMLEKSTRGIYILPGIWGDEMLNFHTRFKRGVFSHETALFLWDLTDCTPSVYTMTFPSSYNLTNPKQENIRCSQCKMEWYELGITEVTTPGGHLVSVYNPERTLCDILRPNGAVDIQVITEGFKRYVTRKDKNISLLLEYAKIFKVEKKVKPYLEVLL